MSPSNAFSLFQSSRCLAGSLTAMMLLCGMPHAQGASTPPEESVAFDLGLILDVRRDADDVVRAENVFVNGRPHRMELFRRSLRAPNFRLLVQTDSGIEEQSAPPSRTYRGRLVDERGDEHSVAGSMETDGELHALAHVDGEVYVIEPVLGVRGVHRVRRSESSGVPEGACGTPVSSFALPTMNSHELGVGGSDKFCKIAIDSDYEFFVERLSSIDATVQYIERTMNDVSNIYELDVGIGYILTTIVVRTTASDPYTANSSIALLNQFFSVWQSTMSTVDRHIAHLMTHRDLTDSPVGYASIGGICNDQAYAWSKPLYTFDDAKSVGLVAHELGHNWSAQHCSGSPCYIMCPQIGGCSGIVNDFEPASEAVIESYRNSMSCLQDYFPSVSLVDSNLDDHTGFSDRFVGPTLDPNRWSYVKGGVINADASSEPDGRSALNLSAFGSGTYQDHEARTRAVADVPADYVISYSTQHRGVEAGEQLVVEYLGSWPYWKELERITSNGVDESQFVTHTHDVPSDANPDKFQLRFRTEVNEANDDWFVDMVRIGPDTSSRGTLTAPRLTLSDPFPPDEAGRISVTHAGDRNADNKDDLMVGYAGEDRVLVYSGATGLHISEIVGGPPVFDQFGASIANPWNIGSGCNDLLWGAPGNATIPGAMSHLCGSPVFGTFVGDQFGAAVASLGGDVNADGVDDFVVGAPAMGTTSVGYVRIVSGANGATIHQVAPTSADPGDGFGLSVDGAGDVTGDGIVDFVVGAPFRSDLRGRVYIGSGATGTLVRSELGIEEGEMLGFCVSGLGDLNGDGRAEFIAGAPARGHLLKGAETGTVSVFEGSQAGSRHFKFFGEYEQDHFGWSVDGIKDINRDGKPDILVGAPGGAFGSDAGASQGECRLFSGATGEELFIARGTTAGEFFGDAVSYGGRVIKKGDLQIIVAAPARGTPPVKKALVFTIPNSNPNIQPGQFP